MDASTVLLALKERERWFSRRGAVLSRLQELRARRDEVLVQIQEVQGILDRSVPGPGETSDRSPYNPDPSYSSGGLR